jgi:hypothetical protein
MMKYFAFIAALAFLTAPAWAADAVADGGNTTSPYVAAPAARDQASLELVWDNGQRRWSVAWYTGADAWVGNEFDASTLKTVYAKVLKYKYYTRGAWPNEGWDGMRFAFYAFRGGVPGSMLWPTGGGGYFFKPSAGIQAHIWVEFDINWTCPSVKFVAAQEQFYDYPLCDPFSVDNNTTFRGHSWMYTQGQWAPYQSTNSEVAPYRNLMIRVWVEPGQTFPGVEPSSVGRVKALYY